MWRIPRLPWVMWLWLDVKCGGYHPPTTQDDQQLTVEETCAKWRRIPTPPLATGSWELKWHVQCGGPILWVPINSWELKWHLQCRWATLHYPPPLTIGSWELRWHVWCGGPTLPYIPIGHWQLRVEAMWNVKEDPHPISHRQLRVEVPCAMWRTLPYPPLATGSWEMKYHMQCGGPILPYPLGHL